MSLTNYRLLSNSGLRVSPLCLGTMTFGEEWGFGSNKDISRRVMDVYAEAGGNFIDTANIYTNGASENYLGEFLQERRDRFVLATKFTFTVSQGDPNSAGNHRKHLVRSVNDSLARLKTDYIDLLWQHAWDELTPIEETMRALDDLVRSGKVLYVGISNMPAWKIAEANTIACFRGWSKFIAMQIEYSLAERTPEREMLPLAREMKVGVTPWSPLGGGVLTGKYRKKDASPKRYTADDEFARKMLKEKNLKIGDEVCAIAKEIGRSPAQVALAWVNAQPGVTSTILGARNEEQLRDNIASLEVKLSSEHMKRLDEVSAIEMGYPHEFLRQNHVRNIITAGTRVDRAT